MPLTETVAVHPPGEGSPPAAPGERAGHPNGAGDPAAADTNERLAQENKRLAQENAQITQERDLLRTLIDSLPDYLFIKDRQSRFLVSNQAHVQLLAATRQDEVVGKSDLDIFPAELANQYYCDEQAMMESGESLDRDETLINPKTGETRWLHTTKVPLKDKEGKVIGLIGISRDITEQKRVEGKLAHEQELLQTLLDNTPDTIYYKDHESRFVRMSKSKAEKTLQSVRDDYRAAHPDAKPDEWPPHLAGVEAFTEWLIGKTDFDTYPENYARAAYTDEQEIIRTGKPIEDKLEKATFADGKNVWWLTTKMPWRDKTGTIIGTFGVSKDVTNLKEAEEALARERIVLRTLIDNIPDGIYAKDTAGRKTIVNPADLKVLGCKTEAEAIGKNDFDFFPKEIAENFWADDQKVLQGEPVIDREEYFLDENGQKRWLLTSKLPLRSRSGKVIGLVGIGRDITERKKAEEALRHSEERLREFAAQLERSNRELQDFAYVASHDLQEPLRKIVVFSERLKERATGKLDPETADYLERMQKAAGRMQSLINELLTFSRVTTKAKPFEPVDLAKVAREVLDDLEGRIEIVKGRVEVGPLPVIDAEALQMRQLLQNLIGNALKFRRPEANPVVKVEAQLFSGRRPQAGPETPEEQLCRLTVSDNGIGFDEKYLDRIFNVFQRLHGWNEYEGTGMGLAIARKIVLFHQGDITAKSKPGMGATFIVTLPVTHSKESNNAVHK